MKFAPSIVVSACALVLLCACGGGGGPVSHPVGPEGLHITTGNQMAITRATVAGGLSVAEVQGATDAGGSGVQPTSVAARAHSLATLLQRALAAGVKARMQVASASAHPAAASSDTEPCGVSGSLTTTFDDRDGDGALSAGDVLTVAFDQCRDSATSLLNGSAVLTLSSVPPASRIVASADFQNVADTEGALTSTVDGTLTVNETDSDTESDTSLTVDGGVTITLASTNYNDVLQLATGMQVTVDQVFALDRTSITLNGVLQAQSVTGGAATLQTLSPLVQLGTDAYPSSGAVKATGLSGTLLMTVLSATQVQLQLDADDDGTYDSTTTVAWTALVP
jgi:hypothetical protein